MGPGLLLWGGIVVVSTTITFFKKGIDKLIKIWYNGGSISGGPGLFSAVKW
jgi:hypothetical protein